MSAYYENMENACRIRGLTLSQVLRSVGKNRSSVGAWKSGSMPSIESCDLISRYLGISIDELVNGKPYEGDEHFPAKPESPAISRDEQEWLNLYHQIPEGKKYAFKVFLLQMIPDDTPPVEKRDELSVS